MIYINFIYLLTLFVDIQELCLFLLYNYKYNKNIYSSKINMKIEYFHYFFINCYLIIFFNYLIISKVRPNTRPKNEKTNLEEFYFFITYFFKKNLKKRELN